MTASSRQRYSGKVRDIYDAGEGRLLMVTSDRISAFDVVMDEPIPDKGRVLSSTAWTGTSRLRPRPCPAGVVTATRQCYVEASERITGRSFADWPGAAA